MTSLALSDMARDPADAEQLNSVLQALLPQASRLRELILSGCAVGELPPCVAAATGLQRLQLAQCGLQQLPIGPYLDGLELLNIRMNKFTGFHQ